MAFNIDGFKTRFGSGVRPNLFKVIIPTATGIANPATEEELSFLCKSAALPESSHSSIEVPFRGRFLKVPGDRTYGSWTATFFNDFKFKTRSTFEQWINLINKADANTGTLDHSKIFRDLQVIQLTKDVTQAGGPTDGENATELRRYKLVGAWPSSVSQISLGFDMNNQVEEFDVTFEYQYFTIPANGDLPEIN